MSKHTKVILHVDSGYFFPFNLLLYGLMFSNGLRGELIFIQTEESLQFITYKWRLSISTAV